MIRAARWLAGGLLTAMSAAAFVGHVNDAGAFRRWALQPPDERVPATSVRPTTGAIIYHLDEGGWSTTNAAAELDAVRAALDQWQAIPGTRIVFEEGALVQGTRDVDGRDGNNTLFWTTNLLVNAGRISISGVIALTLVASYTDGNVILDADTVFNGSQFRWLTDAEASADSRVFVEAIALHEIGHFLGLRHSPMGGATMLAIGDFGVNSQVGLSEDELAAARALYGIAGQPSLAGSIRGVVSLNGTGILGAAVFAEDATGNQISATVSRADGSYDLRGLKPGGYTLRVAPLDPVSMSSYLVRGLDIASDYSGAKTEFLPSEDRAVDVGEGATTTVDVAVSQGSPLRLVRLLRPAPDLSSPSFNNKPVQVQPAGQTVYLGVLTPGPVAAGAELRVSGDGMEVGPTEVIPAALGSLTLVAAPVTVQAEATAGLRNVSVRSGALTGWAHGFLEVLPPFPDVNGDGLDDRFQRRYWTRFTATSAAPASDPDGDGFDNAWEYATGTIPTDSTSVRFAILSVRVTQEGAKVTAETAAGRSFQLSTRETLPGSVWVAVGSPVTATSSETEFVDPTVTDHVRFYRVEMVP